MLQTKNKLIMKLEFAVVFLLGFLRAEYFEVTDRVSLDIYVDGRRKNEIVIGLFRKQAPQTVQNFLKIVKRGIQNRSYNGTRLTKIVRRLFIMGGDIVYDNGTGFVSSYGSDSFPMETNSIEYTAPGFISMLNDGRNRSGCQFFFNLTPLPSINGHHTIFGKIIQNHQEIHYLELLQTDMFYTPKNIVTIENVRILQTRSPFMISDETYSFWIWIKSSWMALLMQTVIVMFFVWALTQLKV